MIDLDNTIDSDDEPDGSEGGYTRSGNYIVPNAMREIVCLRREVEEQRSLISELRQQAQIHAQEARTQTATVHEIYQLCSDAKGEPGNWHGAEPVRRLIAERDELRRESEMRLERMSYEAEQHAKLKVQNTDLQREVGRLRQRTGEMPDPYYETQPGSPNFEGGAAWERYLDEEPTWPPAPDTKPPELADAQIVGVRGYPTKAELRFAAKDAPWGHDAEYRPLYSDSGLPLCSPEGLHEDTEYVATDNDGCVFQYRTKPHLPEDRLYWWLSDSFIGRAPESHRRPGPWYDSLMEVMR